MSSHRILLVDDEAGLREAIADSLRLRGHWVEEAGCAEDAIRVHERAAFNVLISDIRIDKDNGITLARRLREDNPTLSLVFITGYGSEAVQAQAESLGAVAFITKPFRLPAIWDAVDGIPYVQPSPVESPRAMDAVTPTATTGALEEEGALRELLWEAPADVPEERPGDAYDG